MKIKKAEIKHILYATEFSDNACSVCGYALRLADQFKAKLSIIHVIREDLIDLLVFDVGVDRAAGVEKRFSMKKEEFQNAKHNIIKKIKVDYELDEIDEENIVVERGNPVKMILAVAEERKCDLIVMGKKGRGSLEDTLMGDTVTRVLNRSNVPVLVV